MVERLLTRLPGTAPYSTRPQHVAVLAPPWLLWRKEASIHAAMRVDSCEGSELALCMRNLREAEIPAREGKRGLEPA